MTVLFFPHFKSKFISADLTEILKKNPADQKLKETILLTVASLSTKFSQEVFIFTYLHPAYYLSYFILR